ncbi:MAG: DeoR/GlpR family DNA-binding transcription regulator [Alistipes sp.]
MQSIAERHKYILDNLNKFGFVRITDVANELGVTKVTIRKDVKILEERGLLYKVHGSARPANPHVADLDVHVKDNINKEFKRRIARRAVTLLDDNDSIIIASGSTIYAFAEEIKARQWHHLNIVTPFLRLGVLLNESENVNVVQLGGCVHKKSLSTQGEEASSALEDCICSKLFFGVDGIDLEHGITTSTIDEAKLTRKMMRASSQIILLADSSKFGQRGFGRICSLEDIDVIVTDDRISKQMISIVEDAGVDLIIVKQEIVDK